VISSIATSEPLALNGPLTCLMIRARKRIQVITTDVWSSLISEIRTVRRAFWAPLRMSLSH
jgi:hypothetical protein